MWHNNQDVVYTFSNNAGSAFAVLSGVSGGWKKIKAASPDGVTNVFVALSIAKANGRKVSVYIASDEITAVVLR